MKSEVYINSNLVSRGGYFGSIARFVRTHSRFWSTRCCRSEDFGFRLVRKAKVDKGVEKWREELEERLFNEN